MIKKEIPPSFSTNNYCSVNAKTFLRSLVHKTKIYYN